jgi:RNA polymerase sigma factor for flagellar operon FliA
MPVAAAPMNRETVATEMMPLVRRAAAQIARRAPRHAAIQDDLVSAGMEGLLSALDRYDPQRRVAFQAFALRRVKGAMLDELRRLDPLTRDQRRDSRRRLETLARLEQKLGRAPEETEMAQGMGLALDDYRDLVRTISASIAVVVADDGESAEGVDEGDPEAACGRAEMLAILQGFVRALPERIQVVLSLLYVEDLNLREAGQALGVSESRICQIHGDAIRRLREGLVAAGCL